MIKSIKKFSEALEILRKYDGSNPYMLMLKRDFFINEKSDTIGEFQIEYILKNKNFEPKPINKTIKVTKWYAENRKEVWNTDFLPEKLHIVTLLGETQTTYNCYVQYRRSVPPVMCFLPKKAILNNFLVDDYHKINVDFDRYDRLSMSKDSTRQLKKHQKEAIQFLLSRKRCILADEMGCGKTTSLTVAALEGNFDSILIICPASLKTNWKRELLWYTNEKYITIIESFTDKKKDELEAFLGYSKGRSNKKREELLEEAKEVGKWQDNRVVIINYDVLDDFFTFSRATSEEGMQKALDASPILKYIYNKKSCIIIDEAHKLSNNTSTRYKVIKNLIKKGNPECVWLATGTPVTNNPLNLYYLLSLIENEITSDYEYYVNTYCDAKKIPAKGEKERCTNLFLKQKKKETWYDLTLEEKNELKKYIDTHARKITIATGSSNLDELEEKVRHIYLRRTKDDVGTLPVKTVHEVFYSLTTAQKEEYNKLWDEYEKAQLELDPEKEINKELLEGAIYRKYLSNQMVPNTIKITDNIISKGNKVVIACCYDEELYTLKEHYGDRCVIYNGKMNAKQKDAAIDKFTHDENIMVFIGNIIAAGVGITLTVSHDLIFNNISFVPGDNLQMSDRVHRIGQVHDCDIYYQIFKDTQYENMWDIVLRKSLVINSIVKTETEKT